MTVTVRNNQSSFHIGEIIPLDLAFTSSTPNTYQLDMATYDRSGRLNEDQFVVDPSNGSDDPLQLYFRAYKGFMAGGLRGYKSLSTTPATIHAELNEWIRFKTLGAGHGWLPDEARLRRLIDLSVTAAQKQQAEQFLKAWQTRPWPIMFMPFVGQVHIAQFQETSIESAKEKLLQFPAGSAFEWIQFGQEGEQKAFEEMSQFANEHGLKLAVKNVQK